MQPELRIAILASGRATSMQKLIEAIRDKTVHAKIAVLISDKKDAQALQRAMSHEIPVIVLEPPKFGHIKDRNEKRKEYDGVIAEILEKYNVDLILLIGFMRIISPLLIQKYKNKILNIHPSLLPDFAGYKDPEVHEAVLKADKKKTGCTLHIVTEDLDRGPIIMQKEVEVSPTDTPDSLKKKVQGAEQEVLVKAIKLYSQGRIKIGENTVTITQR